MILLYGVTGYTGRLVLEECLAWGLRPVLAGRDAAAVRALADPHGLAWRAASLDDATALDAALAGSRHSESVAEILAAVERAAALTRRLLTVTRLQIDRAPAERAALDAAAHQHAVAVAAGAVTRVRQGAGALEQRRVGREHALHHLDAQPRQQRHELLPQSLGAPVDRRRFGHCGP